MGYKISVPVMNANVKRCGRERVLADLRELDAERVFLSLDCYELDEKKRRETIDELKENCAFFKSHGFEVGAWIWAFMFKEPVSFNTITMVTEKHINDVKLACPADEDFLKYSGEYIADIARCGVDMIMYDDDLRFGFHRDGNMGCLCPLHIKMINEKVGETLTREELVSKILSGGKNKYRDAWIECNGISLENFAANGRKYVDTVDPKIRLGASTAMTGYDIDGTTVAKMAHIMAGKNKPFARLSGAPYWAAKNPGSWGNTLADVIELERMESSWTADGEIELMAEGDTYPRPRFICPASYLEGFDTALRASGCIDGILKYAIDYISSSDYERGYIQAHKRNKELYREIDAFFGDKRACGVRVYESMRKVSDAELDAYKEPRVYAQNMFFSMAARLLDCQGIPTVYEGDGACGIVFGENARQLDENARKGGLIIDALAAKILHAQGIDVGIDKIGERVSTAAEYFYEYNETTATYGVGAYAHKFKKDIRILSESRKNGAFSLMSEKSEDVCVPISYTYENAEGERYFVLNVDLLDCADRYIDRFLRVGLRGRQIFDNMEWLSGKRLHAYCANNPFVYILAKENEDGLAVGMWNFFADPIVEPVVTFAEDYSSVKVGGNAYAELDGRSVRLSEIPPHGFTFFEVQK